jgi:hypothetical protein
VLLVAAAVTVVMFRPARAAAQVASSEVPAADRVAPPVTVD